MNLHATLPVNRSNSVLMEFFSIHKFTLWMMGGVLLSVPIWHDVPLLMGWVGLAVAVIGAVAQVVKIVHDRAEARRKQELHNAKMRLHERYLVEGKLEEAGEMLGG